MIHVNMLSRRIGPFVGGHCPRAAPLLLALPVVLVLGACATTPDLISAVEYNSVELATSQLNEGADPNMMAHDALPVLTLAIQHRHEKIASLLLAKGADPTRVDRYGKTALAYLSPQEYLQQSMIDTGLLALTFYALAAKTICARELSGDTITQIISKFSSVNLTDGRRVSPLMQASQCGHLATMHKLLTAGAAIDLVDVDGNSAIHYAAGAGYPEAIELLLDSGAGVNSTGAGGATPLILAAAGGTPYHVATAQVLTKRGATIDAQESAGDSALIVAARGKTSAPMVQYLLEVRADSALKNNAGKTAADVASAANRPLLRK